MRKFSIILICALLIPLVSPCAESGTSPGINLPVYTGATNLKTYINQPAKGTNAITYQISTIFPARDVTEFYYREMENTGFKKYHDPLLALKEFEWNAFNPRTGEWEITEQPPARYSAKWVNEKEDKFVWLVIDFKPSTKPNGRNGTAYISVHVARFSAYSTERNGIRK